MHTIDSAPESFDSLRERKKLLTRRSIHEAARQLVEEHGFAAASIDDICAHADVSTRTFFNYYPSKADAVLGLPSGGVDADQRARFFAHPGPLLDAMCELVADGLHLPHGIAHLRRALLAETELATAFQRWLLTVKREIRQLAEERTDAATARNAVAIVSAALAICVENGTQPVSAAGLRGAVGSLVETARLHGTVAR